MRKILFLLVLSALFLSCRTPKSATFGFNKNDRTDTVTHLDAAASTPLVAFKAPNDKVYYLKKVGVTNDTNSVDEMPLTAVDSVHEAPSVMAATRGATDPVNEKFRNGLGGGVREEAKTTYATGSFKPKTLKWLVTKLPANDEMDQYNLGQTSTRTQPEKLNVHVKKAWLYVFSKEDDKDYHLLIGNKADFSEADYLFSAEISALAVNFTQDNDQLKKVRKKALDFLKTQKNCNSTEYILSIPVEVKGSLFFDYQHRTKTSKCKAVQANTAWEIHPVYDIVFK
jgi:hypothetical protein